MAQGVNKYKGQPLKVKGLVTIGRVKICQSCKTIKRTCFYCSTYAFWVKLCRRVMREDHCHFTTALSIFMLTPSWVLWENQDHSNASATHRLWNVRSPQHIKYNALFHSVSPHPSFFPPVLKHSSAASSGHKSNDLCRLIICISNVCESSGSGGCRWNLWKAQFDAKMVVKTKMRQ